MDGPTQHSLVRQYDALGRLVGSEEQNNGTVDPATVNAYSYDVGVTLAPSVAPTFVLGHLALASSPTSSVAFSYDALGGINARTFKDADGSVYIEKTLNGADGLLRSLEFDLPDHAYAPEIVKYAYNSAGRVREVRFVDEAGSRELYKADAIDIFGRVRIADHGATTLHAAYAPTGRRLIREVAVELSHGSMRLTFDHVDAVGRELSRTENTDTVPVGQVTQLAYDPLGRLSTASRTSGSGDPFNWQFAYDALGNIHALSDLSGSGGATLSYQTLDRDRLCRIGYGNGGLPFCNVAHDASGNILSEPTRTGVRQLTYFSSGQVRTIAQDGREAAFAYDPFGAVQQLVVTDATGNAVRQDRRYGALIERREPLGGGGWLITRNVPGPGGVVASRQGASGDWVFGFGELRGSRAFTDQDGALRAESGVPALRRSPIVRRRAGFRRSHFISVE